MRKVGEIDDRLIMSDDMHMHDDERWCYVLNEPRVVPMTARQVLCYTHHSIAGNEICCMCRSSS